MAYDVELAERIRTCLGVGLDVSEKRMFGGLAFLVNGSMAVAALGGGDLMVRVDRAETDALTELAHVEPMTMKDRAVAGWVLVTTGGLATDADLLDWIDRGVEAALAAD